MANIKINALKLNMKIKQYMGWFIALTFPFAAKGIMDSTKIPMTAALIYWLICGILLRYMLDKRLPYFRPKIKVVKKEAAALAVVTILCAYLYRNGIHPELVSIRDLLLNTILFAFINGSFEHLVWVNIYDLAGCRIKLAGFLAAFIFTMLIHIFYWSRFMPVPATSSAVFIFSQSIMFILGIYIYYKTEDLTLWSIQHIAYNLFAVYFGGFGINMFIHI